MTANNLPYLENLINSYGHESGLLRKHPQPCAGHDFCFMRQAQKGADAIRAAIDAATLPATNAARSQDWTEDFGGENGNYSVRCIGCGIEFKGHKRRVVCKRCAPSDNVEKGKP